jgi:hypothetical protein
MRSSRLGVALIIIVITAAAANGQGLSDERRDSIYSPRSPGLSGVPDQGVYAGVSRSVSKSGSGVRVFPTVSVNRTGIRITGAGRRPGRLPAQIVHGDRHRTGPGAQAHTVVIGTRS